MTVTFTFHSILFLFLVLTVWTTAMPAPRSHALVFQPKVELGARNAAEDGQFVRRKNYPEVRGYYDELGARTSEEGGQLLGRTTSLEVRGYPDELDARAVGEEQLMSREPRHTPGWLKKIGGFFKGVFNKAKDAVQNLVASNATGQS